MQEEWHDEFSTAPSLSTHSSIPILALVLSFQKDLISANCTEKESTASNLGKYETKMTTKMKSYMTSSLCDLAVLNTSIP